MSRLLLPFADQHIEIPSLSAGNIALTVGLKQVNNFHGTKKNLKNILPPTLCCLHDRLNRFERKILM